MGMILMVLGGLISLGGGLMMLPVLWAEGMLWFFGSLFIPAVSLAFVAMHWEKTKVSFFIQLGGVAIFFVGVWLSPPETRASVLKALGDDSPASASAPAASAPAAKSAPAPAPAPAPPPPPPPEDTRSPVDRMRGECASELSILCSEPSGGKAQLACLREHEDSVTDRCRKALPDTL